MHTADRLLNALVVVMTAAAAITVVIRYKGPDIVAGTPPAIEERSDWRQLAEGGILVGDDSARVTVTVFSDFQCPYCRIFADTMTGLLDRYQGRVRMSFRNLPLDRIHPHATSAARAALCAENQRRFKEYHDVLFAAQDSLGRLGWEVFASRVVAIDTLVFGHCLRSELGTAALDADRAAAQSLDATGTPTILVNQYLVRGLPRSGVLDSLIELLIKDGAVQP